MITVAHYLKNLNLGGTEKSAMILASSLNKKDFNSYFLYHAKGDHPRLEAFRNCFGDKLICCNDDEDLLNKIAQLNLDILHVHRGGSPEFPEPGQDIDSRIKFVETSAFGLFNPNKNIAKTLFMSEWLLNDTVRKMDILTNNYPNRWGYLNNPIMPIVSSNKMDLGLSADTIVVGRCGRPDDGIYDDINVRAVRMCLSRGLDLHFLVVAPPPRMREHLEKLGIPHTIIEPTVDENILSTFYNTIDIYCHARADGETFGCNIAEAMMHGKPVITHVAVPSHPGMGVFQAQTELVKDGNNGFVTRHDYKQYGECLEKLVSDSVLRHTMGRASRTIALSTCHVGLVINKLERIYKEILND